MKRTLIPILLLMVAFSFSVQAQRGMRGQRLEPKEQASNQADELQDELGLSDEQRGKTYDIILGSIEERREKMQALRAEGGLDRSSIRSTFEEIQKETDEKLKVVFSEQQWTLYEKWKEERRETRRRGG